MGARPDYIYDNNHHNGLGSIAEFSPRSNIVLKESNGPRTCHFGKEVTYVTRRDKVLDAAAVQTRIKLGLNLTT